MQEITGLIGREQLVSKVAGELRKGRHVILTGPVGIGKSAVLNSVLPRVQAQRPLLLIHVTDHQAKGQFVTIARRLLEEGIVKPSALELAQRYDEINPKDIEWAQIKRPVNRLSIRDLTAAIIPAIHDYQGRILIAIDDLTDTTPTMVAFWLAVFEKAQVLSCASQKKRNLAKLWWKMTEIEVPPLPPDEARKIAQVYVQKTGMLIEAPDLYISHVVKQANGNPQAIADMLDDSSKERVVDKRKIREMRHAAGVKYVDFTPVVIVGTAAIVGARYLAMGTGDKALYIIAGMAAAVVFSLRFLLFKGAGKAN